MRGVSVLVAGRSGSAPGVVRDVCSVTWGVAGKIRTDCLFIRGRILPGGSNRKEKVAMKSIRESRLGFTLIELLVVIAIIAILAAILFPVFSRARQRANMLSCLSNLKQLSLAFKMYADDNGGRMPSSGDTTAGGLRPAANAPNFCGSLGAYQKADVTKGSIFPYVKAEKLFLCPADRNREASNIIGTLEEKKKYPLSYSMNNSLSLMKPEALAIRVNGVVTDLQPTRMLLLIHEARNGRDNTQNPNAGINDGIFVPTPGYAQDLPDRVHYDGTTIVYLDGHAVWKRYEELVQERDAGYWQAILP